MKIYDILDSNFYPDLNSSKYGESNIISFNPIKNNNQLLSNTTPLIITDNYLSDDIINLNLNRPLIAWLLEPIEIIEKYYGKKTYDWIIHNEKHFTEIWTHDESLFHLNKCKWIPQAGIWIEQKDRKIFTKTKLCSLIASNKNITTGHILRNDIRFKYSDKFDVYGRGVKEISAKIEGLKDYTFSVAVENCKIDTYFTEKIIDCFATGTIPIYWGTSKIIKHFNADGILSFNTLSELEYILNNLSFDKYENNIKAVNENFEIAKKYYVGEEWSQNYNL